MDPISLVMLGMIGLLIIFMVRNGRKRREMMAQLQDGIKPGAEVMLQSGIFATVEDVSEEDSNRITVRSGSSTLEVHRSAVGNIVAPVDAVEEEETPQLAPDDDPNFSVDNESDFSKSDDFDSTDFNDKEDK